MFDQIKALKKNIYIYISICISTTSYVCVLSDPAPGGPSDGRREKGLHCSAAGKMFLSNVCVCVGFVRPSVCTVQSAAHSFEALTRVQSRLQRANINSDPVTQESPFDLLIFFFKYMSSTFYLQSLWLYSICYNGLLFFFFTSIHCYINKG